MLMKAHELTVYHPTMLEPHGKKHPVFRQISGCKLPCVTIKRPSYNRCDSACFTIHICSSIWLLICLINLEVPQCYLVAKTLQPPHLPNRLLHLRTKSHGKKCKFWRFMKITFPLGKIIWQLVCQKKGSVGEHQPSRYLATSPYHEWDGLVDITWHFIQCCSFPVAV